MGREPAGAGSTPAGHPQAYASLGVANSSGREPSSYLGWSGFKPLATHHPSTPSWRNRQTHRSQKPEPARHVRSTRTEGSERRGSMPACAGTDGVNARRVSRRATRSPVAQRQSSALIRRRPVDRAHPGPPSRSDNRDHQPPRGCAMKTIDEDDMSFHGHEQTAQRLPV